MRPLASSKYFQIHLVNQKIVIALTLAFFIMVNTSYFWYDNLIIYLVLVIVYILLVFIFLIKLYTISRQSVFTICLMGVILILTTLKPSGLINFHKLLNTDLLNAKKEEAPHSKTFFKLKGNHKFKETISYFGLTEINGNYELKGDTILFHNIIITNADNLKRIKLEREINGYYKFAIIEPEKFSSGEIVGKLKMYKNPHSIPRELWITKNVIGK